jgi:alkylhydroperoxidase family enzyme
MARIPFIPADVKEPKALVDAVRVRRGGELLELDRLLLHSVPLTEGWNFHLNQVRTKLGLDPKLRELAICTVAVVNQAEYEFKAHLPLFIKDGGTQEQGKALRNPQAAMKDTRLFSELERAVLALTYEMTEQVKVSEATFAAARKALGSDKVLVELVGVVATYNMVSRFLVAFELHPPETE